MSSEPTADPNQRPRRIPLLGQLRAGLSIILQSRVATIGLGIILFWVFVAIFAPVLAPHDPLASDFEKLQNPSTDNLLGTDNLGRDNLSRLIFGTRTILTLAPVSVLIAVIIGTVLGLVAGYFGSLIDEVVMRLLDAVMAFPAILLYLIIIAALGPSALNVVIAITFVGTPGIARLVRSLTLDIRTRDYIRAAETRGENPFYIMFVEILPNVRGPLIIDGLLRVGYAIFAIGTLGFLGLGLPKPTPDWGDSVNEARRFIYTNPLGVLWPILAIASLVVGLNLFADGLREETTRYQ